MAAPFQATQGGSGQAPEPSAQPFHFFISSPFSLIPRANANAKMTRLTSSTTFREASALHRRSALTSWLAGMVRRGGRLWTAGLLLVGFFGLCETLARTNYVIGRLPPPSFGTRHRELEKKLELLHSLARDQGRLDCVVIGDSSVNRGFDPEAMREGFSAASGRGPACFNLGVDRLNRDQVMRVAEYAQRYRPRLTVIGFHLGVAEAGDPLELDISPWYLYLGGEWSFEGQLISASRAYRYVLAWRQLGIHFESSLAGMKKIRPLGYQGVDPRRPRPRDVPRHRFRKVAQGLTWLHRFSKLSGRRLAAEFPMSRRSAEQMWRDPEARRTAILAAAEEAGVPAWSSGMKDLPFDAWSTSLRDHLNPPAAAAWSRRLGAWLAEQDRTEGPLHGWFSGGVIP
jgi:hypothetical protein